MKGPFTGNTSWPLLIVGNSADPVTPVRNAHKLAKGYKGAVVLEQNSEGVGSHSTNTAIHFLLTTLPAALLNLNTLTLHCEIHPRVLPDWSASAEGHGLRHRLETIFWRGSSDESHVRGRQSAV